jgi:predicted dehydrogenase
VSLGVGIIGLGVGERHIAGYEAHPEAEVRVICDIDEQRLAEVAAAHEGVRATASAEDLIDDPGVQVVSIASYDSDHHAQIVHALGAGKHVFVEKPLVQYEEQAREVRALLVANPELRLSSNLPLRRSPRFEWLKEQVDAGTFGRLYYLEGDYDYGRLWKITEGWRGKLDFYSVTLGGTVHLVDLLLWLTGDHVVSVSAAGNQIASAGSQYRFNDFVMATLELESGAIAKVSANFGAVHPHFHGVKLFGTDATFINGLESGTLWRRKDGEPVAELVDAAYPGMEKGDLIHSFVASVLGEGPAEVTEDEVFETLSVCFAIDEAAASGKPVRPRPFR